MAGTLSVKLIKSVVGYPAQQRATVRSLGLRRINSQAVLPDTAVVRGMIRKVRHLVSVDYGEDRNEAS